MRIIPARAGPTIGIPATNLTAADHPRSCGANGPRLGHVWARPGSSPLVRGQPSLGIPGAVALRIIPARAGPTRLRQSHRRLKTDHPRSCGANAQIRDTTRLRDRIIPARAGPTTLPKTLRLRKTDHPRSCGANGSGVYVGYTQSGSSPLVRGQQSDFTRKKRVESNKNI